MPRPPFKSAAAWACLLIPLVLGLGLDLYTKHLAFQKLVTGTQLNAAGQEEMISDVYRPIPGYLQFQAHVNRGAVFGIAQNQRTVFVVVSIAALALLIYLFSKSGNQRLYQVLLGILFAGVLGNLYDRAVFGYVRDMIYILPGWDVFPWIFNIADSLLCTGVGGMFVYTLLHGDQPADRTHSAAVPSREA